jgi:formate hydrogenlyase subunit 3/multisubunit Na+/H+ antiporter MnhD subunit
MSEPLIWPVALPLLASLLALVWPRQVDRIGLLGSGLALAAAAWIAVEVAGQGTLVLGLGGWNSGLGIALRADPLAASLLLMSAGVAFVAGLYAAVYFADARVKASFWPLWLMLIAALHALLLSGDLFNVYITLELLGLSAVALTALGARRAAIEAALRYLMLGLIGSMLFLAGVVILYAAYGTLDLPTLAQRLQPQPAAWTALFLMTAGLLIKAALFPLHFWLPAAHANAPAPVSAALSALVVKAAFYLVLRLWFDLFAVALIPAFGIVLGVLGGLAVLWGSWRALHAQRLKLLAAYSTVAQLGYLFLFLPLLLALPAGDQRELLFGALILYALTHGFAKGALFLGVGVIQQHAGHDRIEQLGGTARALPLTTFALALSGIALIGLPPSGTFLAKWQLIAAAIQTGQWPWLLVVVIGSLLAAAYVFRILGHAFGPVEQVGSVRSGGRDELPAMLLALIATLYFGLGAAQLWAFLGAGPAGLGYA